MDEVLKFQDCDSQTVFAEVTNKAHSSELRTMWTRLLTELQRNSVAGAISFLDAEFDHIRDDLETEVRRLKAGT